MVFLVGGPGDPVSLSANKVVEPADMIEFGVVTEYSIPDETDPLPKAANPYATANPYAAGGCLGTPDVKNSAQGLKDRVQGSVQDPKDNAQDTKDKVQDKAQDMVQNVTQTAQDIAGKAQDAAQSAAEKAKDAAQAIADKVAAAKTPAADAGTKSKSTVSGAASTIGMGLWSLVQRSPLQAIFFVFSLIWLLRNNSATAAQTPVSVSDAAKKVGTLSGQVQVTAGNLGDQVKAQAQHGTGWFSAALQENPLVIGAMALVAGLGLGLAVPETSYENKALGKTRDHLLDKATEAASDLTRKVTTAAQTAVHDAVESGKAEAKNQGLAPQDKAPAKQPAQEQLQQQQNQQQ